MLAKLLSRLVMTGEDMKEVEEACAEYQDMHTKAQMAQNTINVLGQRLQEYRTEQAITLEALKMLQEENAGLRAESELLKKYINSMEVE